MKPGQTIKNRERIRYLTNVLETEYVKGTSIRELSVKYKCSRKTVKNILESNNTPIVNRYHNIDLNTYFKDVNCEESAYWLGFLYADGSNSYSPTSENSRYVVELCLAEKDKNHIKKFKAFIGSNKKIEYRRKMKAYRLTISCKELSVNLHNLGLVKNKTYEADLGTVLNNVPKELLTPFIRGVFDGDGHISKDAITAGLTSYFTEDMLTLFNIIVPHHKKIVYFKDTKLKIGTGTVVLRKEGTLEFLNKIYNNSTVYLDRKYQRHVEIAVLRGDS